MITFLIQVVIISLSGVMAPGPMSAVTVGKGYRNPHAGALISLGHGIVEIPLMMLLLYGLGAFLSFPSVSLFIGISGAAVLLYMGIDMLRMMNRAELVAKDTDKSPIVAGLILSAANPYFLVWWATIGITLISRSVEYGVSGVALFAVVHWLCDFFWLWFLSAVSYRGGQFFGQRFQRIVFFISGVVLLGFSVKFFVDSIAALR